MRRAEVRRRPGAARQFQGHDSTVITLTTEPETDYWQFFRDADAVLQDFEPRAHWGKIHFMTRSRLERLYPELDTFMQVRREFDPRGMFLNDHTRALFG